MITTLEAKKGGLRTLPSEDKEFKTTLATNRFIDLQPYIGFFTWNNRRRGGAPNC